MSKRQKRKIETVAILTGGGDCPGLNAVIRAVTRTASLECGWDVVGIEDGFAGLVEGRMKPLTSDSVSNILTLGGTILGASNQANPFKYAKKVGGKIEYEDASKKVMRLYRNRAFDVLVCIGGEGTMMFASRFAKEGLPIVGIPKTIDNDVPCTERTVGFYTAVSTAIDSIDKLHTTAASHHRVMIVEVMGRESGWLALASSLGSGADIILIPELPFDRKKIYAEVKRRSKRGRRFTIIVVGEGAREKGGKKVVKRMVSDVTNPERLGGIAHWLAELIEKDTGIESRAVTLGHVLRGGSPIYQDRLLASCLGFEAVKRLKNGEQNIMVAWQDGQHFAVPLEKVTGQARLVPKDHHWIQVCRAMGATFAEY